MKTITLPSHWFLVTPCGCIDGSLVSVRMDGTLCAASAEQAWQTFTPNKRARDKEARLGWTVRGATDEEMEPERFRRMMLTPCTHEVAS